MRCFTGYPRCWMLLAVSLALGSIATVMTAGCNRDVGLQSRAAADSMYTVWQFVDGTGAAGLSGFVHTTGAAGRFWLPETMGAGVGVLDYDRDGWPDIVLVRGGRWENNTMPALALYRNTGDGSFLDVTEAARLDETSAYGMGVAVGDYDNDGDPDILLTTVGRDHLYRNDGGRFADVASEAGLSGLAEWSTAALWVDADRDGWLDLYIGNYVKWSPETDLFCSTDGQSKSYCTPETYEGEPGRFYHNNRDGTFTDWTERAGFGTSPGKTLGAASWDVNHDGWPDLVIANDTQRDELYVNNADGTFTERGMVSGVAFDENGRPRAGMGIDVGVVDPSGEASIFVGNFSRQMLGVYRHSGGGRFADRAARSKIGRPSLLTLTFGLVLFDADLDGDLDLFAANGHIIEHVDRQQDGITYRQPPHLFLNDGEGHFTDAVTKMPALQKPLVGRGAAMIDFDRDGDQDVLLTENGGPVYLFENTAADVGRRFVKVTVAGHASNRSGYGTELVAVIDSIRQVRTLRSGSSYLSHSEATVLFGLGRATQIDTLIVRWPSGKADTLRGIEANAVLHLVEGNEPLRTK